MRGIVRASVHTTRFRVIQAQVTRRSFDLHSRHSSARVVWIVHLHWEWVHIDVPIRTIVGALAAANAPILNDHFERVSTANRTDGTADHAKRVTTLPARSGNQIAIEAQPVTNQPADAIVSVSTGPHALVTTRAAIEVENQQALRFHQALAEELVHGGVGNFRHTLPVLLHVFGCRFFELPADLRKAIEHDLEVFSGDADHLHMIKRAACRDVWRASEQRHLGKV